MNEREALLRAVCEHPDDDTPRLVFADWLQEHGDEPRAEFIRLQVQFAALHRYGVPAPRPNGPFGQKAQPAESPTPEDLRKQERVIWAKHKEAFQSELPEIGGLAWFSEFHRGFVERCTVSTDTALVRHAEAIFNHAPVQHVEIRRFTAAEGFATLPYLRRLKTLKLHVSGGEEAVIRRLMQCDQFNDSALVFVYCSGIVSPALGGELRKTFGDRIQLLDGVI